MMEEKQVIALRRRTFLAGLVGNIMEWYDFAVYGYFAPIIGRHFFPSNDPNTSLIAAFGVFAAGFLMRPIGGLVFGYIGDKIGRKAALTASVITMAIPTFLIGVLPDYSQIGVTASVLLVILRMVQGVSVGGEYTTSVVFLVEAAEPNQRGFAGSWSAFGAVAGMVLGSALGALLTSLLSADAIHAWGWRVPFILGLGVGIAGLYIREQIAEPIAIQKVPQVTRSPILEAFRSEWRAMLRIAGLNVLNAVSFYTVFVYLVTYLQQVVHISSSEALSINTLNMIVLLVLIPFAGALSDRWGRKPILFGSVVGVLLFSQPLFWAMHHPNVLLILFGQMGFAILLGLFLGVVPVTMVEAFPGHVRCSALSISYNLCSGILGGTTPMVLTFLVERTHDDLSPAYYMMASALVSLVVILRLRETFRDSLASEAPREI